VAGSDGSTGAMTGEQATGSEQVVIGTTPEKLPRVSHPHAQKFRVALAVLFGVAVGAIAIAIAVAVGGSGNGGTAASSNWSSWAPDSGGSQGVSEIADHVAPYYRVSSSQQLDVITPISVAQPTAAGTTTGSGLTVVVNTGTASKSQSLALLNGKTVAYNICGLGPSNCQLPGTPSISRMLLMRREALELALYTFKYIGDSENVLAVLPPGKTVAKSTNASGAGSPVTVSVLFVRRELQPWLNVPLSKTLQEFPPDVPELPLWTQSEEAGFVDQITAHGLFSSQVESLQVGGNALVLSQLPPQ
jgi:hypothetical protein